MTAEAAYKLHLIASARAACKYQPFSLCWFVPEEAVLFSRSGSWFSYAAHGAVAVLQLYDKLSVGLA